MVKSREEINAESYSASDIQVLPGMEAVRMRPGMYIGSTDQKGLHHLIFEIVDNGVDEFMGGYASRIDIHVRADGSVRVDDDGRGIPVDIHQDTGLSAVETVMTTLHAGGKFGGKAYAVSGGLHGVGASVVNALSSKLTVDVYRDGQVFHQEFSRGGTVSDLTSESAPDGRNGQTGTTIIFEPDPGIFEEIAYDFNTLSQRFKEMA